VGPTDHPNSFQVYARRTVSSLTADLRHHAMRLGIRRPGALGSFAVSAATRSATVRREVLIVLGRRPAPSPPPTDPPEGPDDDVTTNDHPRTDVRSVEIPAAPAGRDLGAVDVRVLDRVEIDGAAVGVLGPCGGPRHEI